MNSGAMNGGLTNDCPVNFDLMRAALNVRGRRSA